MIVDLTAIAPVAAYATVEVAKIIAANARHKRDKGAPSARGTRNAPASKPPMTSLPPAAAQTAPLAPAESEAA